jgi:poly-gamma-glutamate synthesis protein (capsule biosynthesis protein)
MKKRQKSIARHLVSALSVLGLVLLLATCGKNTVEKSSAPPALSDLMEPIKKQETDYQESAADGEEADQQRAEADQQGAEPPLLITISAAGDVSLGNHQDQDYAYTFRQMYDQVEDKGYFFQNVRDIFEKDDFTLVNLEGVLTFSETQNPGRTYYIKGDPDYANLLALGGIEAVSMGNNHRQDFGEQGTKDTVQALREAGIVYAYDKIVGLYETKGVTIGYVSVNEASMGTGVEAYIQDGIKQLQAAEADLILIACHWGVEKEYYPDDYQKELGHKCIDWGADLVLGHHPHVLQGIESYQGKYIVYSLANFCFGANRNPPDKDTMIFQQTFVFQDGKKAAGEAKIIPCSVSSVTTRNDYCPTPAVGEEAQRILKLMQQYSQEFGTTFDEKGDIMPKLQDIPD